MFDSKGDLEAALIPLIFPHSYKQCVQLRQAGNAIRTRRNSLTDAEPETQTHVTGMRDAAPIEARELCGCR